MTAVTASAALSERAGPTPLREIPIGAWWVLALMTTDYMLGIIDRNTVSILKTTLKAHFQIGDSGYSLLVTAFMVPYALSYIPCGRLVDRYGTRITFTMFVSVWSAATVAAGLSRSLPEMAAWRAVLGAAEAGLLPATIYALVRWFPKDRLATVYAIKNPLQTLGPIISPPLIAGLALAYGWRAAFWVPGAVGLAFAGLWYLADRNPPTYRGGDAPAAVGESRSTLLAVARHPLLWGVLLARLVSDSVWFFMQYWQAGYLEERLGLTLQDVGRLLWIPPLLSVALTFGVAATSDNLIARGWRPARSRIRLMQATTVLAPLIAIIPLVESLPLVIAIFATTYFMAFTWLSMSNILMADLFSKQGVGTAVGIISCVGTLAAAAFNAVAGPFIDAFGYVPVFAFLAILHPIAALVMQRAYRELLRPEPA